MTQITDTSRLALLACEEGFDPIEDRLRANIRGTIEAVFNEELNGFLGRLRYGRTAGAVKGYRHGNRDRQIIGTFGTETISVPRARIEDEAGRVSENGSAKVCHGSGGIVLLRAEQNFATLALFWRQGGRGYLNRGTLSEGPSRASGRHERTRGSSSFWGVAREREEDHGVFDAARLSAHSGDQAAQAGWVHRLRRSVAAGRPQPEPQATTYRQACF